MGTVVRSWPGPHNHRQPQSDNNNQPQPTTTMSKIFSWEYLSFVTLDDAVVYKEVLLVPALIVFLSLVWMQLVKGQSSAAPDLNFEQAYQGAVLNEVDSGTELDSQGEEEETPAAKEEEEKKEDLISGGNILTEP